MRIYRYIQKLQKMTLDKINKIVLTIKIIFLQCEVESKKMTTGFLTSE